MQQWSENLTDEYLAGPQCTIPSKGLVAQLLSAEWYASQWPLIPREELMAPAVDLPHDAQDGSCTTTKVLMHERRVSADALVGADNVCVCASCITAAWRKIPVLPRFSLANFLWLGRHHPLFQRTSIGHQLLLALGRVVSTKVYLSSKGADQVVRQQQETWRRKFLQHGMTGSAIVFENGSIGDAMASFPPQVDSLKDTFVAIFCGPDEMQGVQLTEEDKQAQAKRALRKEVEFQVQKDLFDQQARRLLETNYVYHERATYRTDLVDALPETASVPACIEACATFVPERSLQDDSTVAYGPGTSTARHSMEQEALELDDAQELNKWMSLIDEQSDDTSEMTSLPALQGLLERMESQAGRVVASELAAVLDERSDVPIDEVGRERLRSLCKDFHDTCQKLSREEEIEKLHWRVCALEQNKGVTETIDRGCGDSEETTSTPCLDSTGDGDAATSSRGAARLRVPFARKATTWWNPAYWSIARPTDFLYGDCVSGVWKTNRSLCPLSNGRDISWRGKRWNTHCRATRFPLLPGPPVVSEILGMTFISIVPFGASPKPPKVCMHG